jgi:hypothetical protein
MEAPGPMRGGGTHAADTMEPGAQSALADGVALYAPLVDGGPQLVEAPGPWPPPAHA